MSNTIAIKKLYDKAVLPTKGSSSAAGYDLYACVDEAFFIQPHTTAMIDTGLSMEIPEGYWGGIYARSGIASKNGIRPANCVGVIDSDYRGPVKVALHNDSDEQFLITPSLRIAQFILHKCEDITFIEKEELNKTARGNGGFGSSGK